MHFLLIVTISCRDVFWLVAHGLTVLSASDKSSAERAEAVTSFLLAQKSSAANPVRQALATYLHFAGIDRSYGYFAPNVPVNYKLVFELHYPDGSVDYELPPTNSAAAELRLASLLDAIGRTRHDQLREYLVKMVARSVWRQHPNVTTIRAVFGSRNLPSIAEFEQGARESYEFLYAYDFSRVEEPSQFEKR